jgi:hypothetical protein
MAVAAEVVVGRHDIRSKPPDQPDEAADRIVDRRLPEAARVVVAGRAHHPGVAVAEGVPLGHAERLHRGLELRRAKLTETTVVLRRGELGHHDLAEFAPRAGDEDDSLTLGGVLRHRPAGADGLVVRMGVDGHEREAMVGGRAGLGSRHGRQCYRDAATMPSAAV